MTLQELCKVIVILDDFEICEIKKILYFEEFYEFGSRSIGQILSTHKNSCLKCML